MYDSASNVNDLNQNIPTLSTGDNNAKIIDDPNVQKETAVITRQVVTDQNIPSKANPRGMTVEYPVMPVTANTDGAINNIRPT